MVIGGTTGLGLSGAKACLAADARVVVVGRNPDSVAAAAKELGSDAHVFAADAADPATTPTAIRRAIDSFGTFSALYHVAGGSGRRFGDGPLHDISDAGWRQTMDLNLSTLFYSNRAAALQLMKQGTGGSILNMSSVLAWSPSPTHFATHAYAAAKAAIIGLTRSAAAYYAKNNIRFNVIAPGLIETPMSQRAVGDEQIVEFVTAKQPLDGGRVGTPEDLDDAVISLLSDASKFVTGQVLAVDGGWSVSEGKLA